jgi:hypothetical protein
MIVNSSLPPKRIRYINSPLVVSLETNPTENTYHFVQSLINNNWDYDIIGIGKPWYGFKSKLQYYPDYLQTLDPERLVILSDSRDVFCVRSPDHFVYAFQTFNKPLLVSLEIFCQGAPDDSAVQNPKDIWQCVPLNEYWKHQSIKPTIRRYVNSGLIVGKTKDLIEHYNWIKSTTWKDDQAALGDYMNKFPNKVAADVHASVLHTSGFGINAGVLTKKQWEDSPSLAELTGRKNYFLHLPGLEASAGQKKIYNVVKKLISQDNISHNWLVKDYPKNTSCTWDTGIADTSIEIK